MDETKVKNKIDSEILAKIENSLGGLTSLSPMMPFFGEEQYNKYGYDGLVTQEWTYLSWRYMKDSLFRIFCELYPKEAILGVYKFSGLGKNKGEPEKFRRYLERNAVIRTIYQTLVWTETYGGGAVLVNGRKHAKLKMDTEELIRTTASGMDIDMWSLQRWQLVGNINSGTFLRLYNTQKIIHKSRLVLFRGILAPHPHDKALMGWGMSIAEHLLDTINKYYVTFNIPFEYIAEAKTDVIRLHDLAGTLASNDENLIQSRLRLMDDVSGKKAKIILDKLDEYQTKSYTFGGLSDMMEQSVNGLVLETQVPRTRLLGEQTGGFSNKDTSADMFQDRVEEYRAINKPEILKVFEIAYKDCFKRDIPDNFNFEFPTKQKADLKDIASAAKDLVEIERKDIADKLLEDIV